MHKLCIIDNIWSGHFPPNVFGFGINCKMYYKISLQMLVECTAEGSSFVNSSSYLTSQTITCGDSSTLTVPTCRPACDVSNQSGAATWPLKVNQGLPLDLWEPIRGCHLTSESQLGAATWPLRANQGLPPDLWEPIRGSHLTSDSQPGAATWTLRANQGLPPDLWEPIRSCHLTSESQSGAATWPLTSESQLGVATWSLRVNQGLY